MAKTVVNRSELLAELNACGAVVEKRVIIPITACVLLEAKGETLNLRATDIDRTVITSCGASGEAWRACVDFEGLRSALRAVSGDSVTLEYERDLLKVDANGSEFSFPTRPTDDFPAEPELGDEDFSFAMPVDELRECLRLTAPVALKESNEIRAMLNGVAIREIGGKINFSASDGHFLSVVGSTVKAKRGTAALLNNKSADAIRKIEGEEATITAFRNFITAESGHRRYVLRRTDAEPFRYDVSVPKDFDISFTASREAILSGLKATMVVTGKNLDCGVVFTLSRGTLLLQSEEKSGEASAKSRVACDYSGTEGKTVFASSLLYPAIELMPEGMLMLELRRDKFSQWDMMRIRPVGDTDQFTLLGAMRLRT